MFEKELDHLVIVGGAQTAFANRKRLIQVYNKVQGALDSIQDIKDS